MSEQTPNSESDHSLDEILKGSRILVIDDDEDQLFTVSHHLKGQGCSLTTCSHPSQVIDDLGNPDLILLDMHYETNSGFGEEGFHWLSEILKREPDAAVIMITSFGEVELAVKAIRSGAIDFLPKPLQHDKVISTLRSSLRLSRSEKECRLLRERQQRFGHMSTPDPRPILGDSPSMVHLKKQLEKVAQTDAPVFISGPFGSGKSLIARELHRMSSRSQGVFIEIDLDTLAQQSMERQFLGSHSLEGKSERGWIELATGGSLYLKEIGNLPLELQKKLLQAIEQQDPNHPFHPRWISSSRQPLTEWIEQNLFSQNLYYTLNTVELKVPGLTERKEDLPQLTEYFLDLYAKKYGHPKPNIDPLAMDSILKYSWPGNLRELQRTLEQAIIMKEKDHLITLEDLHWHDPSEAQPSLPEPGGDLHSLEKRAIENALKEHNGNISKSARTLGISRAALYRKIKHYEIQH